MENNNETRKLIYTLSPKATFIKVRDKIMYYSTTVEGKHVEFRIPMEDTVEADFTYEMEAKYLQRWIYNG